MSSSPALTALKKATEALRDQYVKANPKSAEAYENAKISGVAGGTNRASIFYSPFPLTFVNANEATAITADGQHLTDFLGNFTAGLFGFSPTPVKEAVAKAMDNGHALGGAPNLMEARVAKAFTSRLACELLNGRQNPFISRSLSQYRRDRQGKGRRVVQVAG